MLRFTLLWLSAVCLATLQTGWAQTYAVTWEQLKNAEVAGTTVQRPLLAVNRGMATSKELLYGSDRGNSPDGSFEYTISDLGQIKRIGFAIMNSGTSVSDAIDYGFSFLLLNQVKAFSASANQTTGYATGNTIKVARIGDKIRYFVNGSQIMEQLVDPRQDLALRVELTSLQAKFTNVVTSFNSQRMVIQPVIDNVNNKISLSTGGSGSYTYQWANGEKTSAPDLFFNETYGTLIRDVNGNVSSREYGLGTDATWGNFSGASQTGNKLVHGGGLFWGRAYSTQNFSSNGKFWTEYIAVQEPGSAQKSFGIAGTTTTVSSFTNLLAGFLISSDQLQIVFNGVIISTLDYYAHDAIQLFQDQGLIKWKVNGVEVHHEYVSNLPPQFHIVGLVRNGGTINALNFDNYASNPLSVTWLQGAEQGDVNLDIAAATGSLHPPFHYLISDEVIPGMNETYHYLKDTLGTDPDSLEYYTGDVPGMQFTFPELPANDYFVTVFDTYGKRIYGRWIKVQPSITLVASTNMNIVEGLLTTASATASTGLEVYTPVQGDFTLRSVVERSIGDLVFGTRPPCNISDNPTSSELDQGFTIVDNVATAVFGGLPVGTPTFIKQGDALIIERRGAEMILKKNQEVIYSAIPQQEGVINQVVASIQRGGLLEVLTPVLSLVGIDGAVSLLGKSSLYQPVISSIQLADCDGGLGAFRFIIPENCPDDPIHQIVYTLRNMTTNQNVPGYINVPGTTNVYYILSSLTPGIYRLSGGVYLTSPPFGPAASPFSVIIYVGVGAEWIDEENYIETPDPTSIERGPAMPFTFSYARTQNILLPGETGWIIFKPVMHASGIIRSNYLRLSTIGTTPPANDDGETRLSFTGGGLPNPNSIRRVNYRATTTTTNPLDGTTTTTTTNGVPTNLPMNATVRVVINANIMRVYVNDQLRYGNIPRPPGIIMLRAYSTDPGEGFDNVQTSFDCHRETSADHDYFEVKKVQNAGYATALDGKVLFTLDEEYSIDPSKQLEYTIYNDQHRQIANCTLGGNCFYGASPLTYELDDNRYTLDLSTVFDCDPGTYYYIEIKTSTEEKRYFKFFYKN